MSAGSATRTHDGALNDQSGPSRGIAFCTYVPAGAPRSGEQIRVNALVHALAALGAPVYAFVPDEAASRTAFAALPGVKVIGAELPWPQLSRTPVAYWRVDPALLGAVGALAKAGKISTVLLSYGFLGQYIKPFQRLGLRVIVDTHNAQAEIIRQYPAQSLARRLFYALWYRVERWHERHYFPRADAVICVSAGDRDYHAAFIRADRLRIVPNFIAPPAAPSSLAREPRIIMTGSFTNFQNLEGARWFVERVWSAELAGLATFCLAGRGSAEALAALKSASNVTAPNVMALGERPRLHDEIARSICAVAPILHASGTRLKCVEALALETPLVSTSLGADGIDHGGAILIADTPEEFRAKLLALLRDPQMRREYAARGLALYHQNYSLAVNAELLRGLVSGL
jgi:glycosyltransferase involved in cell wall biosynthesis